MEIYNIRRAYDVSNMPIPTTNVQTGTLRRPWIKDVTVKASKYALGDKVGYYVGESFIMPNPCDVPYYRGDGIVAVLPTMLDNRAPMRLSLDERYALMGWLEYAEYKGEVNLRIYGDSARIYEIEADGQLTPALPD